MKSFITINRKRMKKNSQIRVISIIAGRYLIIKPVLFFMMACFIYINVSGQNSANIIIQPTLTTTTVTQSFTVDVRIDFTTAPATSSVDAVEVHLTFDKTKLAVTSITKSAIGVLPTEAIPLQSNSTINSNGQINYAATTNSGFPNTDFVFLTITFNVTGGAGSTTPLTFLTSFPNKTDAQRFGTSIIGSVSNGTADIQNSTLPVTLYSFSASPGSRKITLHWTTSTEINNRGFEIQRSNDGLSWVTVGFVASTGNSNSEVNYTYPDNNLEQRKYYYRLKQMDIDNRTKYSMIVTATLDGNAEYLLGQNYPNPFINQTTIQFALPQSENVNLSLYDANGRILKVLVNAKKDAGTHAISLNTESLSRGVYYYRIIAGDFISMKKMSIQ